MSLEFDTEHRNATPNRCCSFCRGVGHNISTCNSEPIRVFERNILLYIGIHLNVHSFRTVLQNYLIDETIHDRTLVRAFAISRCGANTRSSLTNCVELIVEHFMLRIQNNQDIYEAMESVEEPLAQRRRRQRMTDESLLYAMLFIDMIRSINSHVQLNRKFNITTNILETQDNLEQNCECSICYEEHQKKSFVKLKCGHDFCKECIRQTLCNVRTEHPMCALCRSEITNMELSSETIRDEFNELIIEYSNV